MTRSGRDGLPSWRRLGDTSPVPHPIAVARAPLRGLRKPESHRLSRQWPKATLAKPDGQRGFGHHKGRLNIFQAALQEPKSPDRELLDSFGQYRPMSSTGASESTGTDAALIGHSLVDPECFSLIVERHATSVFRYLTSRVGRSSSEDLLADVFEAAFRARERYDTRYDDALPWLLGIATNVIRHHRRSESRHASMVRRVTQLHGRSQEPPEAVDVGRRQCRTER